MAIPEFTMPSIDTLCPDTPPAVPPLSVTFPGGATLQSFPRLEDITEPLKVAKSLVDQAAPLLSSLAPFFKLLDLVVALVKLGQSIPDAITSLSPQPIIEALQELLPKAVAVASLIPQLSVPLTIVGLIDTVITFLQGLVTELQRLSNVMVQADAAIQKGMDIGSPTLQSIGTCLRADALTQTANLSAGLGPLGKILEIINLVGSLAGLPGLPSIGDFTDPTTGVQVLSDFVQVITDIRNNIPV